MITRVFYILLAGALLLSADEESDLQQRVRERAPAIAALKTSCTIKEDGNGGLLTLKRLEPQQMTAIDAENADRRRIFELVAEKSKQPIDAVTKRFAERIGKNAQTCPDKVESATLRLHGSNTIGVKLAPALIEAFLKQKGATNVQTTPSGKPNEFTTRGTLNGQPIDVQIHAHGSSTAFTDLLAASTDIGMSSRKILKEEVASLAKLGNMEAPEAERVIGLDVVTAIVNSASPTESLTREDAARIFAGETAGWKVYARADSSGTLDFLNVRLLAGRALAGSAERLPDIAAVVAKVAGDPIGIGFVSKAYASNVKSVPLYEAGSKPVPPTIMDLKTEAYPYVRRLYFYLPANASDLAKELATFALSDPGQDVVESAGFTGLKVKAQPPNPPPPPGPYADATVQSDRFNLDLRFQSGSRVLDSRAYADLDRILGTIQDPKNAGRKIMLFGFADGSGSRAANLALSKDRAAAVAAEFLKRGVTPAIISGFGQDLPVAPNDTAEGREKNRRVEVWLRR